MCRARLSPKLLDLRLGCPCGSGGGPFGGYAVIVAVSGLAPALVGDCLCVSASERVSPLQPPYARMTLTFVVLSHRGEGGGGGRQIKGNCRVLIKLTGEQ